MEDTFSSELEVLINKYSMENGSDTPDFILKEYVLRCLENFDLTLRQREQWFGRPIHGNANSTYALSQLNDRHYTEPATKLTQQELDTIVGWLNTWNEIRDTPITIRFEEEFGRHLRRPIGYVDPEKVIKVAPVIIREDRSEPERTKDELS